jgi:hypothetical protein
MVLILFFRTIIKDGLIDSFSYFSLLKRFENRPKIMEFVMLDLIKF